MKSDRLFFYKLQLEASRHLPPHFARQVIHKARHDCRRVRERRVVAITGAICLALAVSLHWFIKTAADRDNLAQWDSTSAQIWSIESSL